METGEDIQITAEELAEKYPPSPKLAASSEVFVYPVSSKKSNVISVAFHRARLKLRIQYRDGHCVEFSPVTEEHFLENYSHGATIDDKLVFRYQGKFIRREIAAGNAIDWEATS